MFVVVIVCCAAEEDGMWDVHHRCHLRYDQQGRKYQARHRQSFRERRFANQHHANNQAQACAAYVEAVRPACLHRNITHQSQAKEEARAAAHGRI